MKRSICFVLICMMTVIFSLTAAADEIPSATGEIFSMDTYMTITCYGDDAQAAVDEALEEIRSLNNLLSIGVDNSEIAALNLNGTGSVSDASAAMIDLALDVYRSTNGAFDITILPMMELWGFTTMNYHVPTEAELAETLPLVNSSKLQWNQETQTLTLGEGQGIDLGGIAKGYTSDRLMEIFAKHDLVSGLVSLGGNVHCYQSKPDGSLWRVGIQSPHSSGDIAAVASVADRCVITSGGYERNFTDPNTGKVYHHIIDPTTGYSAESGLISATIISERGILADTLSTACFVMGLDRSTEYWRAHSDEFEMVLIADDDHIYITEGLKDNFKTDYPLTVITRS